MDSKALARRLEGDAYAVSRRFRALLESFPLAARASSSENSLPVPVEEWCRWIADNDLSRFGLPPKMGGDPLKFLTLGYELGLIDFSLMMRYGLQFGFVMRAISRLGSVEQLNWLDGIADTRSSACFAMTEVDHGSNVRALQTTATYRPECEDFLLHTPEVGAEKDWVTNLSRATHALVFARLATQERDHGVHAFWVELRKASGELREGVILGEKRAVTALHGLDFGRLSFKQLSIPKKSLLSRYARLDEEGHYRTLLRSEANRFNAMLGTLVVGRALVAGGAAAGAKKALAIALHYTAHRRQFGASGEAVERTVLSYQSVQRKLIPALATVIAVDAGRERLTQVQHDYMENSVKDRELETFTAAFKSYLSRFAVECVETCRQCCGGAGCLESSGLPLLRAEVGMFTTMEGDNTVLDLMVARNLLTDHARGSGSNFIDALSWVGKSVTRATQIGPLRSRDSSPERVASVEFLSSALRFRRDRLRESLGRRVSARLKVNGKTFDVLNECQNHCLALARAYCEDKIFRCLRNLTESCPPGWDRRVLDGCLSLFGLSRIEEDRGWFLEQGFLSPTQSESVRRETLKLCSHLAGQSEAIISAFELTESQLSSSLVAESAERS